MINLREYQYSPNLRSRTSEINAIMHLSPNTKLKILPCVSLSKNHSKTLESCLTQWEEAFPHTYIIDINKEKQIMHEEAKKFLSGESGVSNWTHWLAEVKEDHTKMVPTAIYYNGINKREYVKQIRTLNESFNLIAVRANPENKHEMRAATTAASVVDDVTKMVFILDLGQVTLERQQTALKALISAINSIRDIDQGFEIITCGSSFPNSFPQYGKRSGEIPMLEWEMYHSIGGKDVAIYGDHGSIHANFYEGSYAKFVARVDYPSLGKWVFERRSAPSKDEHGNKVKIDRAKLYQQAASDIIDHDEWDDSLDFWGVNKIVEAAKGEAERMGTPSKWIEVRVNCHIERILNFLENNLSSSQWHQSLEEDDDSDDW